MLLEEALEIVNDWTAEELKTLNKNDYAMIMDGMTQDEIGRFFMEKNVKVFGGIDGYVNDFLNKVNLQAMNEQGKGGARILLNKMLLYPGISEGSRKRIQAALASINYESAPAAGGRRMSRHKSRRKSRKTRGLKRTRVRR
jgi:hypothetical protein